MPQLSDEKRDQLREYRMELMSKTLEELKQLTLAANIVIAPHRAEHKFSHVQELMQARRALLRAELLTPPAAEPV